MKSIKFPSNWAYSIIFACLLLLGPVNGLWAQKKKAVDPAKALQEGIDASYETFKPAGMAVAVVKNGEIIFKKAYGTKVAGQAEAVDTRSLFNIASCSKAFTAASLALLVEEGKIRWTDRVVDHLPGFQLADPWISSELRILDLLCHRSGLATFYGDLLWYGTDYTDEEIMHRMRYLPMKVEFRSEFGYQNNMYMVAGLIIKKVTGQTWSQFVEERFFKPLQMTQTFASDDELPAQPNLAAPHIEGKPIPIHDFVGTKPAASIFSNVEDLSNWMRMLMNGGQWNGKQVLSQGSIKAMFSPQINTWLSPNWESWGVHFKAYGLGWAMFDYAGKKVVEHNGGMPGYISKVAIVPEENIGVVVLNSGMDGVVNDVVRFKVIDQLLQHPSKDWDAIFKAFLDAGHQRQELETKARLDARVPNTQPSLSLEKYAGTYTDRMYGDALVEMKDGGLFFTMLPTKKLFNGKLEHFHYDSFKVQFQDASLPFGIISFELGPKAEVKGFKIDLPNGDFHFFNLDFRKKQQ